MDHLRDQWIVASTRAPRRVASIDEARARRALMEHYAAQAVTLYHGTAADKVAGIRQEGLHAPEGVVGSAQWYMLTTSFEQAQRYARDVVLEFHVPAALLWDSTTPGDRDGAVLWPGGEHNAYGFHATAYALRRPLDAQYLTEVHEVNRKTADSWRGLMSGPIWTEHDGFILTDRGGSGRRTFETYVDGETRPRFPTLAAAKAYVESQIGPCTWARIKPEPQWADHYYFGPTDAFTDPTTAYAATRI